MSIAKKELNELYTILAQTLTEQIKSGEAGAALLNVARQFLKDNHIGAVTEFNPDLQALTEVVPFEEPDEYGLIN